VGLLMLTLVLLSWIAAAYLDYGDMEWGTPQGADEVGVNYDGSGGAGAGARAGAGSSSERKKRFKEGCSAAIESVPDLDAADVEEYAEYVEKFGKLDRYLNDGCEYERNYRAYEGNKRRIDELNAAPVRFEVVNGRVFTESFAVNEFTDCDDDCRKAYLEEINPRSNRRRLRQRGGGGGGNRGESGGSGSESGSEWDLNSRCIKLDQAYFKDVNAAATEQVSMWSEECGAIKNQGELGTCWAFSATAQLQCNFNAAHQDTRVFSEKYGTDCSDQYSVNTGGAVGYLDEWYTENGACSDYYKAYDDKDSTDYDGDCDCNAEKAYGQCYEFTPSIDEQGKLAIANAAQLYALSFGVYLCSSFFDVGGDNAVWYGCGARDEIIGGHGMTIVGQDAGHLVLVRNSWGTPRGWGSSSEPGHVWFHSDVWSSEARMSSPFSFNYFRPQTQPEHEAPTAKCHEQGPCDSGFMDTSDGASTRDKCSPAADCAGGDYVDSECNCVCQAAGTCDSESGSGGGGRDPSPTIPSGDEDEDEDEACPTLVSSGFDDYSWANGDWTYLGEHEGKPYYEHQTDKRTKEFLVYSDFCGEYMITDDIDGTAAYCRCGHNGWDAKELSECEWECWGRDWEPQPSATTLTNCGSSENENENENENNSRTRTRSSAKVAAQSSIGGKGRPRANGKRRGTQTASRPVALIAFTTDQALAVAVALLICVNVCVVMELMRRRAGAWCTKTRYAKVQMVEEDSEAEQILQVSN